MGEQNGSATLEARWQFVLNILYIWSSCQTSRYLLKEMKTYVYAKPCTQIFMAVLKKQQSLDSESSSFPPENNSFLASISTKFC